MFPVHSVLADNQNDKTAGFNTKLSEFDSLFGSVVTIDIDNTNRYTVSDQEFYKNRVFVFEDGAGADAIIRVTVPSTTRPLFVVRNDTSQLLLIRVAGQSFVRVGAGTSAHFYFFNNEIRKVGAANTAVYIASVAQSTLVTPATSINADYPEIVNADELLIIVATVLTGTIIETPTNYTLLSDGVCSTSGTSRVAVFAKIATGTEGGTTETLTVTGSAAVWAVQIIRVVGGAGGINGVFIAKGTAEIDATPDVPALTIDNPVTETLWLAVGGNIDDAGSVSSAPTNYVLQANTIANGGVNASAATYSAKRSLNAVTDDPGDFTLSESEGHLAFLIGVVAPLDESHVLLIRKAAVLGGSSNGASISLTRKAAVLGGSSNGASISLVRLAAVI